MPTPLAVRDPLTIVFLAVGGYCLLRCVRPVARRVAHRYGHLISECAHLGMSAGMVAMVWRPAGDRWGLQLTFFALACGWFLLPAVHTHPVGAARLGLLHQAVAMAAMFWMVLRISAWTAGPSRIGMVGMDRPAAAAGGVRPAASVFPAAGITLAFAGYLGVAALWWLGRSRVLVLGRPGRVGAGGSASLTGGHADTGASSLVFGPAGQAACQAVMAAATMLMLVAML